MLHKFYEWYCIVVNINIYLHYQTVHICQRVRFLLSLFYTDKFCWKNFTIDVSCSLFVLDAATVLSAPVYPFYLVYLSLFNNVC